MHRKINSLSINIFKYTIALLLAAASFGCSNESGNVQKEFNKEGIELLVTVESVSSSSEMSRKAWDYKSEMKGQALYSPNDNKCEIVFYKPKRVDGKATLTLGHELMHCLYGDYHD